MMEGWCLCGATRWGCSGDPLWGCFCHCDACRRQCGAPVAAWQGVPREGFVWTGKAPRVFASSKGVSRYSCGDCGSPLGFEAEHYPGSIHLLAGSLERPEAFVPEFHVNIESRLPWLELADDLPKFEGTVRDASGALGGGGSGRE